MLLRCPSCSARYAIDAAAWPIDESADGTLLQRPRKVRCRRCQEVWLATPEADDDILDPGPPMADPAPRPVATPVPAFFANRPVAAMQPPEPVASKPRRVWPWLLALTLAGAGLYAAVALDALQPERIGLPPLAPWAKPDIAALNLPAISLPAIALPVVAIPQAAKPRLVVAATVKTDPIPGGGSVWSLNGRITNPTDAVLPLPPIELTLVDAAGTPLSSWRIRPPAAALGSGKQIDFAANALNPPPQTARIRVTLKPGSLARL